jgi:transcriptional regulator with XRE-family HTH domain
MDFRLLHLQLVAHVRARVRNGEISERSLARLTGISQPHIHNALKGVRVLSADMADRILGRLRIDMAELLTAAEGCPDPGVATRLPQDLAHRGECRMVALLDGWIGREYPYPKMTGTERYPFLAADVERLELPVAARLAPDPQRTPIFGDGGVVLLDRAVRACRDADEEGYFALDLSGGGTIGMMRRANGHLYLWARHAEAWECVSLSDRDLRHAVQGRVSLVARNLWH